MLVRLGKISYKDSKGNLIEYKRPKGDPKIFRYHSWNGAHGHRVYSFRIYKLLWHFRLPCLPLNSKEVTLGFEKLGNKKQVKLEAEGKKLCEEEARLITKEAQ